MSGFGDSDPTASSLPVGEEVGGYIVDGELGAGSMGVVYSATHPVIGKRAAIKVLRPELSENPEAIERFVTEARAVNQIGHRNIVNIFGFGKLPDGRNYYVMDLLAGESLHQRLRRGGPLHVGEAASIIDEIASALIAAHDKGIIHRDLKPENIFLVNTPGRWPEVSVLDWGVLKLSSAQSAVSSGKIRTLAGSLLGTPVYMSPEQARGAETVDARTDVYALGVIAYEVLTGSVPFERNTSLETIIAHQDEAVPSLAKKRPAVPAELVQLIEAMLAKKREDRPTLAAVRAVIKRLQASKILMTTAAGLVLPSGPRSSGGPKPEATPREMPAASRPPMERPRAKPSTIAGHSASASASKSGSEPGRRGVMAPEKAPPGAQRQPTPPGAYPATTSTPPRPYAPPDAKTQQWQTPIPGDAGWSDHAAPPSAALASHVPTDASPTALLPPPKSMSPLAMIAIGLLVAAVVAVGIIVVVTIAR